MSKRPISAFNKPSEFHRLKELFNTTLLNLTLWVAIASFSFQIATDIDIEAMQWFSEVTHMNAPDNILLVFRWIVVIAFGVAFVFASLCAFILVIKWFFINIVRFFKRNKEKTLDKTETPMPLTKIDIHIETSEPIEKSINNLVDRLRGNDDAKR